jgi:hypothetical protein
MAIIVLLLLVVAMALFIAAAYQVVPPHSRLVALGLAALSAALLLQQAGGLRL